MKARSSIREASIEKVKMSSITAKCFQRRAVRLKTDADHDSVSYDIQVTPGRVDRIGVKLV